MKIRLFILDLLLFFVIFSMPNVVKAQSCDDSSKCSDQPTAYKYSCLTSLINRCQNLLSIEQRKGQTLSSQLNIIDAQARVTQLKIDAINLQITQLNQEVNTLSDSLNKLSITINDTAGWLLTSIIQTYKYGNYSLVDLLFSSTDLSQILERFRYIQIAQANDKKVLYQLQATKAAYHDQKQDKQTRQTEAEKLSKQLADYQKDLDRQKVAKAELLRVTQNNEAVYQQKLQAAIAEQNAILSILSGGGNEVKVGPVHKGDTIGNVIAGKSACSSGTHLHFEVHQNSSLVNPAGTLSGHSVTWDDNLDSPVSFSGSWDWPITDPIYIEQPFGNTWYAQHGWYTNPPGHTGVDMFTPSTLTVKAVHDGTLSTGGIACGGGTLRYKKIDHGDGYSSYYLHMY